MILDESGHFLEFTDFIRQHGLEDFDSEIIGQLKSALWAVVSQYLPLLRLATLLTRLLPILGSYRFFRERITIPRTRRYSYEYC